MRAEAGSWRQRTVAVLATGLRHVYGLDTCSRGFDRTCGKRLREARMSEGDRRVILSNRMAVTDHATPE